jgi:hypothetical protein
LLDKLLIVALQPVVWALLGFVAVLKFSFGMYTGTFAIHHVALHMLRCAECVGILTND